MSYGMAIGKGIGLPFRTAPVGSLAGSILAGREGIAIDADDDSMVIYDEGVPANNYQGSPGAKGILTRNSIGTYWGLDGLIKTAGVNELRLDYDPRLAGKRRYLLEKQATNLLLRSEEFNNAVWGKSSSSISANAIVAPDGTLTADKLVEANTLSTHTMAQTGGSVGGQGATFSCFLKAGERTWSVIQLAGIYAYLDLVTGVIGTIGGGSAVIEMLPLEDDWWRCSTFVAAPANSVCTIYAAQGNNVSNYQGDGVSGIYTWGAQFEVGDHASSYIPTTTAVATREADSLIISATLFPYSLAVESLGINFIPINLVNKGLFSFNDGTAANRLDARVNGSNFNSLVSSGGADTVFLTTGWSSAPVAMQENRFSMRAAPNDYAGSPNGGAVQVDAVVTMPAALSTLRIGAVEGGTLPFDGWLKSFFAMPVGLTNTELQEILA